MKIVNQEMNQIDEIHCGGNTCFALSKEMNLIYG